MTQTEFETFEDDDLPILSGGHASSVAAPVEVTTQSRKRATVRKHGRWYQYEITPKKVKAEQLMNFSRQCASFVTAGVPLVEAIDSLAEETDSTLLATTLTAVANDIRGGASFATAMNKHPNAFPSYYRSMLRSAEYTGELDAVLDRLAQYLHRDIESRRKVRSALTYPAVVGLMSVATVVVLAAFVLPRFRVFFAELDAKLPLPTRMLLAFTDFLTGYWTFVIGGFAALVVGLVAYRRTPGGRLRMDHRLLKIPALGKLIRFALVERFCRVLGALLQAGVPIHDALSVATETTTNRYFKVKLDEASEAIMGGRGLATPLADTGLFPSAAKQMMRVGEATGSLDRQLESSAAFFERELDYRLKKFTDLFEPAVIIFMGFVVGFVAIALVSAMYGIYRQVKV